MHLLEDIFKIKYNIITKKASILVKDKSLGGYIIDIMQEYIT